MWFVLRAVVVIALIAFFSPERGGAEREAVRLAEAGAHRAAPAQRAAGLPEPIRERAVAEAGRALAHGAEAALRGALAPGGALR